MYQCKGYGLCSDGHTFLPVTDMGIVWKALRMYCALMQSFLGWWHILTYHYIDHLVTLLTKFRLISPYGCCWIWRRVSQCFMKISLNLFYFHVFYLSFFQLKKWIYMGKTRRSSSRAWILHIFSHEEWLVILIE